MLFNSDAPEFGGKGLSAKSYKSEDIAMHGFDDSISLTLAPLSVMYLKAAPARKKAAAKADTKKTKAPVRRKKASAENK